MPSGALQVAAFTVEPRRLRISTTFHIFVEPCVCVAAFTMAAVI